MRRIRRRLRSLWQWLRREADGVLAALTGVLAMVLALRLPRSLDLWITALNQGVARRLAGTGAAGASLRSEALVLAVWGVGAAVCALLAAYLARRYAQDVRERLRRALEARRDAHAADGLVPPEGWDEAARDDLDALASAVAHVPRLLAVGAGIWLCIWLLARYPAAPALCAPITGAAALLAREALRRRGASEPFVLFAIGAVWAAGALAALAFAARITAPALTLGGGVVLLLLTVLIVPVALMLSPQALRSAWAAYRRVRAFLKSR